RREPNRFVILQIGGLFPILGQWLSSDFLAGALAGHRLLDSLLLSRLQIKGVFLNFLDDIFLQNLTLKSPQCSFNGLAFVNLNLRHLFSLDLVYDSYVVPHRFPVPNLLCRTPKWNWFCTAWETPWDDDIAEYWMQSFH